MTETTSIVESVKLGASFDGFRAYRFMFSVLLAITVFGTNSPCLRAADIEPRAYSNIPVGINFLVVGYAYNEGNVAFDPSVPIKDAQLVTHNLILAYARSFELWGKSGKFDFILPEAWLSGTAKVLGQSRSREVSGFADPLVRLYLNLFGAPALSLKDFASYKQNTIIGLSLAVTAPAGQYDSQRLVNIGANRWSFKPEIGISKALGPLTLELAAGAYFFTDNEQPFQGNDLQQAPIYAIQGHFIYSFGRGFWGSLDTNYYFGGQTTKDGVTSDQSQANWRLGATFTIPLNRRNSVKIYGNTGIYSRTGSNFDTIGIIWQYRWGQGL